MLVGYSWCENYQVSLFTWNIYLAMEREIHSCIHSGMSVLKQG